MLSNDYLNTIVLSALMALVLGVGLYITQKKHPAELERLEHEETSLRLRHAEISELLIEQAGSRELAEDAVRRWNARYKILPTSLSSPAVVSYLNRLSMDGFQSFDVSLGGVIRRDGFSILSYDIRGRGFYEALYGFIWEVENGRGLYKVNDLNVREVTHDEPNPVTEVPRRMQLVDFSMTLEAYFGGVEGMSAPDSIITVPDHVLPARQPVDNPFYPLVLAQLPPNTDNLIDVEQDELVSVVGSGAVFRTPSGRRTVHEGGRVYLGRLTTVDSERARIVADLSKGGIRERVEVELATGERFRQAIGRVQLAPLTTPRQMRPSPPQPGTPEYLRQYGNEPMPLSEPVDLAPADGLVQPERGLAIRPFPGMRAQPEEVEQD